MPNRFLETNYFKSPFVKRLSGKLKCFYSYIICDCTASGIWYLDLDAAKHFTGFDISFEDFDKNFIQTGKAIAVAEGKYFFPDFIEHQYLGGLSDTNKAHKNILSELRKYNLLDNNNLPKKKAPLKDSFKESLYTPLKDPFKGVQGLGIGNDIGIGNDNNTVNSTIIQEEKFIVPRMCLLWYKTFSNYTKDKENDYAGMGKILQFMIKQANIRDTEDENNQTLVLGTLQLIADQVNRETFWLNKPIKSIANNIQEFYNHIKNPINGTKSNNSSRQNGFSREGIQAELAKRIAKRQQT